MADVLDNCSAIVDVGQAQCAVDADRVREMSKIEQEAADQGGLASVNRALSAALRTGMVSVHGGIMEVDNFLCGEPEGLRNLPVDKVQGAVRTVCAAGLVEVLDELLEAGGVQQQPRAVRRTTHHQLQPEPQVQSQPHSLWQRGVAAGWLCPEAGRYSDSGGGSSGGSGTSARVRLREATIESAVSAATATSSLGTIPAGDNREREDAREAQAQLDARERELAWREKLQRSARVGYDVYGGLVVASRVVREVFL